MNDSNPTPETIEIETELVAYLDGELDHASAQRVERRLSEDPEFRRRLQQLQRAWDLLDQLPRVEASENFASTTVEMVALRAATDSDHSVGRWRRRRFVAWSLRAMGLAAAIVVGYLVVQVRQQAPERRFLRDLPVIENVDLYLNADDIEFVRQLQRESLFEQELPDATSLGPSRQAPRDPLAHLSPQELDELRRKRDAFELLSPDKQQWLRDLHHELDADPKSAELRETLQHYSAWSRTLPAGRRAELLSLPADERLVQVQQLLEQQRREQEQRMPRPVGRSLQGDDVKVLMAWLDELLTRHDSEIVNLVPPGFFRDRLQQTTDPQRRRATLLFTLSRRMGESGAPLDFPTEDDYQTLAQKLSPSARQELEALATRKEKGERVLEWARSQYMSQFQPLQPSRDELEKYFRDEISPNDRAWLEGLPPERFARELRRHYQMQQMRRAFDPQRLSPGKPVIPGGKGRPVKGPGGSTSP